MEKQEREGKSWVYREERRKAERTWGPRRALDRQRGSRRKLGEADKGQGRQWRVQRKGLESSEGSESEGALRVQAKAWSMRVVLGKARGCRRAW